MKKIAVIFPGIGYNKDKPLLYYAAKLIKEKGYDIVNIEYKDMPQKIRGDIAMMKKAAELAFEQCEEQLASVSFDDYDRIIFAGKSIGTVAAAEYAGKHDLDVCQIWYTPVEATFSFGIRNALAFIGDADPWSDLNEVRRLAKAMEADIHIYPDCNHSLECDDVERNIVIIKEVMGITAKYMDDRENERGTY